MDRHVIGAVSGNVSDAARVARLPLAHLSIEVGHLYAEEFDGGPERLRDLFRRAAPWERAARLTCAEQLKPVTARISTCFLVDDYFSQFSSPEVVVPQIIEAASEAGLRLDYLARESACVAADGVEIARLVEARMVPDPPPGTNGTRPPASVTGWLCNGERSPHEEVSEAMQPALAWRPPSENGRNNHSIFVDVQLWDEVDGRRRWSCPYLAAVWQLLRLGLLRHMGQQVARPRVAAGSAYPARWDELPPIIQLTEKPAAFSAFRTCSVLDARFLPVEHAVRTILSQLGTARTVREQMVERAAAERPAPIALPAELVDRIEYIFAGPGWR